MGCTHAGQRSSGGVYLNEEGRRRLIQLFEERLLEGVSQPLGFREALGEAVEVQAYRLKAALLGRGEYTSLLPMAVGATLAILTRNIAMQLAFFALFKTKLTLGGVSSPIF